jgi:hypothetical protein
MLLVKAIVGLGAIAFISIETLAFLKRITE